MRKDAGREKRCRHRREEQDLDDETRCRPIVALGMPDENADQTNGIDDCERH
jgi:hypothetical protein